MTKSINDEQQNDQQKQAGSASNGHQTGGDLSVLSFLLSMESSVDDDAKDLEDSAAPQDPPQAVSSPPPDRVTHQHAGSVKDESPPPLIENDLLNDVVPEELDASTTVTTNSSESGGELATEREKEEGADANVQSPTNGVESGSASIDASVDSASIAEFLQVFTRLREDGLLPLRKAEGDGAGGGVGIASQADKEEATDTGTTKSDQALAEESSIAGFLSGIAPADTDGQTLSTDQVQKTQQQTKQSEGDSESHGAEQAFQQPQITDDGTAPQVNKPTSPVSPVNDNNNDEPEADDSKNSVVLEGDGEVVASKTDKKIESTDLGTPVPDQPIAEENSIAGFLTGIAQADTGGRTVSTDQIDGTQQRTKQPEGEQASHQPAITDDGTVPQENKPTSPLGDSKSKEREADDSKSSVIVVEGDGEAVALKTDKESTDLDLRKRISDQQVEENSIAGFLTGIAPADADGQPLSTDLIDTPQQTNQPEIGEAEQASQQPQITHDTPPQANTPPLSAPPRDDNNSNEHTSSNYAAPQERPETDDSKNFGIVVEDGEDVAPEFDKEKGSKDLGKTLSDQPVAEESSIAGFLSGIVQTESSIAGFLSGIADGQPLSMDQVGTQQQTEQPEMRQGGNSIHGAQQPLITDDDSSIPAEPRQEGVDADESKNSGFERAPAAQAESPAEQGPQEHSLVAEAFGAQGEIGALPTPASEQAESPAELVARAREHSLVTETSFSAESEGTMQSVKPGASPVAGMTLVAFLEVKESSTEYESTSQHCTEETGPSSVADFLEVLQTVDESDVPGKPGSESPSAGHGSPDDSEPALVSDLPATCSDEEPEAGSPAIDAGAPSSVAGFLEALAVSGDEAGEGTSKPNTTNFVANFLEGLVSPNPHELSVTAEPGFADEEAGKPTMAGTSESKIVDEEIGRSRTVETEPKTAENLPTVSSNTERQENGGGSDSVAAFLAVLSTQNVESDAVEKPKTPNDDSDGEEIPTNQHVENQCENENKPNQEEFSIAGFLEAMSPQNDVNDQDVSSSRELAPPSLPPHAESARSPQEEAVDASACGAEIETHESSDLVQCCDTDPICSFLASVSPESGTASMPAPDCAKTETSSIARFLGELVSSKEAAVHPKHTSGATAGCGIEEALRTQEETHQSSVPPKESQPEEHTADTDTGLGAISSFLETLSPNSETPGIWPLNEQEPTNEGSAVGHDSDNDPTAVALPRLETLHEHDTTASAPRKETGVKAKMTWLQSAFTPTGDLNMDDGDQIGHENDEEACDETLVHDDYNGPLFLEKSGDAYEWAYELWYQRGLLKWRPQSFHDADADPEIVRADSKDLVENDALLIVEEYSGPAFLEKSGDPYEWAYELWFHRGLLKWRPQSCADKLVDQISHSDSDLCSSAYVSSFDVPSPESKLQTNEPPPDRVDSPKKSGGVKAKMQWLQGAFTSEGEGQMAGLDDDNERGGWEIHALSPTAQVEAGLGSWSQVAEEEPCPDFLDKSGDPFEWAYDVWHRRGLIRWQPSSSKTAGHSPDDVEVVTSAIANSFDIPSPDSKSQTSALRPDSPKKSGGVKAKMQWLQGAFTSEGEGQMTGLDDDNERGGEIDTFSPTAAQVELGLGSWSQVAEEEPCPDFLDKSDDPFEWAYDVWHRRGLIRWQPSSSKTAGHSTYTDDDNDPGGEIDTLSPTAAQVELGLGSWGQVAEEEPCPDFLDKSDDPFEWAYDVWHRRGLIRWQPSSSKTAGHSPDEVEVVAPSIANSFDIPSPDSSSRPNEPRPDAADNPENSAGVRAKMQWLQGAFTSEGEGQMTGLDDDNERGGGEVGALSPTAAQAELGLGSWSQVAEEEPCPDFLDKSDDPFEWAYDVWYRRGLIRWQPSSSKTAGHSPDVAEVVASGDNIAESAPPSRQDEDPIVLNKEGDQYKYAYDVWHSIGLLRWRPAKDAFEAVGKAFRLSPEQEDLETSNSNLTLFNRDTAESCPAVEDCQGEVGVAQRAAWLSGEAFGGTPVSNSGVEEVELRSDVKGKMAWLQTAFSADKGADDEYDGNGNDADKLTGTSGLDDWEVEASQKRPVGAEAVVRDDTASLSHNNNMLSQTGDFADETRTRTAALYAWAKSVKHLEPEAIARECRQRPSTRKRRSSALVAWARSINSSHATELTARPEKHLKASLLAWARSINHSPMQKSPEESGPEPEAMDTLTPSPGETPNASQPQVDPSTEPVTGTVSSPSRDDAAGESRHLASLLAWARSVNSTLDSGPASSAQLSAGPLPSSEEAVSPVKEVGDGCVLPNSSQKFKIQKALLAWSRSINSSNDQLCSSESKPHDETGLENAKGLLDTSVAAVIATEGGMVINTDVDDTGELDLRTSPSLEMARRKKAAAGARAEYALRMSKSRRTSARLSSEAPTPSLLAPAEPENGLGIQAMPDLLGSVSAQQASPHVLAPVQDVTTEETDDHTNGSLAHDPETAEGFLLQTKDELRAMISPTRKRRHAEANEHIQKRLKDLRSKIRRGFSS